MSELQHKITPFDHFNTRWLLALTTLLLLSASRVVAQSNPVLVDPQQASQQQFTSLTDITFTRLSGGIAQTTLVFDRSAVVPSFVEADRLLSVRLPATRLAEDQLLRMDVTEFATPVNVIESFQEEQQSLLTLSLNGFTRFRHFTEDNRLIIQVETASQSNNPAASDFVGEPISLDFQDVPVRQVLQIIAQVNGFNLVTTDSVSGNVTVSLSGVPWDQALNMILKIKGLDKRLEGNILLIAPTDELTARETQQLQNRQQVAELAPLNSVNIQINYAKAQEMANILKNGENSILSSRGTVSVDERTNTLLVRDTQASIDEARELVEALDIPVKQVLIESRMVTVRDNVDEQLGVRWGFTDQQNDDGVSGSLEGAETVAGGVIPPLGDRLNVNLPVTAAAGKIGFHVASLVDGTILDLELSALESENKGEVIASPRITVANQQEAYIEQGTEIPYVQSTSSGATSVEFKKAVLSLKVTPQITPDNRIILNLVVTQDTRGETVSTSTGPAVAIDTQEISTQVLVDNGETIVLGGIFQQNSSDDIAKVPLFGDLPLVGGLFRSKQTIYQKRELLIFVTPKILTESL